MYKMGDIITSGIFTGYRVSSVVDNYYILQDVSGNMERINCSYIKDESRFVPPKSNIRGVSVKRGVVLKDGSLFLLSRISKSERSRKKLLDMLRIYLHNSSLEGAELRNVMLKNLDEYHQKNKRQLDICLCLLDSEDSVEKSLTKALLYLGCAEEKIRDCYRDK